MNSVRTSLVDETELGAPTTGPHPSPPLESLEQTLPFNQLTWEDFERLCYRVAVLEGRLDRCVRFGAPGDTQGGIDLYVRLPDGGWDVWQCKKRQLTASLLREAAKRFMAGEWAERSRVFRVVTSSSVQNAGLQREAERLSASFREQGIEFVLVGAAELSQTVRSAAQAVVDEFFGPAWAARFLGRASGTEGVALELFGRHLRATCAALTRSSLNRLTTARLFKPEATIAREAVERSLSAFQTAPERVMPLIGASGVGKTSVLSRFASMTDIACPVLLVQGCDIVSGDQDIWTLVSSLAERALGFDIPANQIASAVGRQPLLIVLDALDQAGANLSEIRRRWIPSTLDRLSDASVKLVVSCRPEYWQATRGAWRDDWIFPPSPKAREPASQSEQPPPDDAPVASAERFIWIGDFDAHEAKAALRAYGLEGELTDEEVRYPFILHAVDTLGGAASPSDGLARIIDALLAFKVEQVVARLGQPAAFDRVARRLQSLAQEMLERDVQVIGADEARAVWDSDAAALDLLSEENVLIQDAQGVRFQHDQVRERLQAEAVDPDVIFSEIVPRPKPPEPHWSDRLGLGPFRQVAWTLWDALARSKAERHVAAVPASVASFALLERLRAPLTPQALAILDVLDEGSDPRRADQAATWAALVVEGLLRRMPSGLLEEPQILEWLVRLLARDDHREMRQADLASACASALLRSKLSAATVLSLVPWVVRAEKMRQGMTSGLANDAHFDKYMRTGPAPGLDEVRKKASPRLIARASHSEPILTIEVLAGWLDEGWSSPTQFSMEDVGGLRRFAAMCLYRTREIDPIRTVVRAIQARGSAAEELRTALCIAKPDLMVVVVSTLSDDLGPDLKPLLAELLWQASNHALAGNSRIEAVKCAAENLDLGGVEGLWAARAILANYRTAFELRDRNLEWPAQVLAVIEPFRAGVLRAVRRNLCRAEIPPLESDFTDVLAVEFRGFLRGARRVVQSGAPLPPMALAALLKYLSRWNLQDGRRTWPEYLDVRALLGEIWAAGDRTAQARMGAFAISACAESGCSALYYLQADDVIGLDLLGLAVAAIDLQLPEALDAVARMVTPPEGRIRSEIFAAVGRHPMTEDCVESLAWNLAVRSRAPDQISLADLLSFRTFQKAAWDRGVVRWMAVGGDDTGLRDRLHGALSNFSPEDHSEVSLEYVAWRAKGATPYEAAEATRHLSVYGKQAFERSLASRDG